MTSPSTIIEVKYIAPQPAWQVAANADVWTVLTTLSNAGYNFNLSASPNDPGGYQITLSLPDFPTLVAFAGDWIVFDGLHASVYTNAEMTAVFTVA
jgi:hypothetical protein